MLPPGGRVLAALSGGPDSIALVHVLATLGRRGHLVLAGIAHFNHQLRGAASDQDEAFCRNVAAGYGVPWVAGRADVREAARRERRSLEDAARTERYAFLERAAEQVGAEAVAVGHTRDDQAETFLLRLLRGAGPGGLAGIRPVAGRVIRPLLDVGRLELHGYADAAGLEYRTDLSNDDVSIPRNRVRHDLLPHLQRYSGNIAGILSREAAIARADHEFLEQAAIDRAASIVLRENGTIALHVPELMTLHPALRSRVVRHAVELAAPASAAGFEHIEGLLDLACRRDGDRVKLPGTWAIKQGDRVMFSATAPSVGFSNSFRFPLSIPGEVELSGWAITASRCDSGSWAGPLVARADHAVLPDARLRPPLWIRSRRPGDRFRPIGMGGRGRKLQDYLVDRKVPRDHRDALPLVVDRDDRIIWVVGHGVAEDFRVTAPDLGVILLKARRLGGLG